MCRVPSVREGLLRHGDCIKREAAYFLSELRSKYITHKYIEQTHEYIDEYLHTYLHTVYMSEYVSDMHTHIHTCIHAYIHTLYMSECVSDTHIHMHTYTHAYMYIHIHAYIYCEVTFTALCRPPSNVLTCGPSVYSRALCGPSNMALCRWESRGSILCPPTETLWRK